MRFHIQLLSITKPNLFLIDVNFCQKLHSAVSVCEKIKYFLYYQFLSCNTEACFWSSFCTVPQTAVVVLCSLWKRTWLNESFPQWRGWNLWFHCHSIPWVSCVQNTDTASSFSFKILPLIVLQLKCDGAALKNVLSATGWQWKYFILKKNKRLNLIHNIRFHKSI